MCLGAVDGVCPPQLPRPPSQAPPAQPGHPVYQGWVLPAWAVPGLAFFSGRSSRQRQLTWGHGQVEACGEQADFPQEETFSRLFSDPQADGSLPS